MFKVDFDIIFKEIQELPINHLGAISGKLRGKCEKTIAKTQKNVFSIFTIIIGFYLFKNAIIKKVGLGPFNIEDVNFILYFMPLVVAYLLWIFNSNLYKSSLTNYMIYVLELKQFGFSKRSKLLIMSLPSEEALSPNKNSSSIKKKGCRSGCAGCLVALPTAVLYLVAVLLFPLVYIFIIYFSVTNYQITFYEIRLLYWIPTVFTFIFLFNSIIPIYKLIKFANYKYEHVKSFDEEE